MSRVLLTRTLTASSFIFLPFSKIITGASLLVELDREISNSVYKWLISLVIFFLFRLKDGFCQWKELT